MTQIKVGICVAEFPTPSETFIVTKVLGLLAAGFDVQIFAARQSRHWDRFDVLRERDDVRARVHVSPYSSSRLRFAIAAGLRLVGSALREPWAFTRYVRHNLTTRDTNGLGLLKGLMLRPHFIGHQLDILHIEFDMQAIGTIDLKDYLGARVLLSSRGTLQRTNVLANYPDAPTYWFSLADGYHFISEYLRANTHDLGLESNVIPEWLIEPAIDLSLFSSSTRTTRAADEPFRVISVGRLSWEKGYEFAIDAIGRVHAAGVPVELTILGEGPYEEAIRYAAGQRGLLDNGVVRLLGAVPRESVVDHYRAAHVMLHAALDEGFCNAVIEGQAMGLPVIVTDVGGLPENVANGITGFVVPQRDPEEIARKLLLLAGDEVLRQAMGANGRARVEQRFALHQQIEKFCELYRELAKREPRANH